MKEERKKERQNGVIPGVIILIIIAISVVALVQYFDLPNFGFDLPEIPFLPKKENGVISITGKILYYAGRDPTGIYMMNPDGSNQTLLIKGWVGNFALSSDGKNMAYSDGINIEGRGIHVYVRNLESGKTTQLTHNKSTIDEFPDWSPDGKSIAFASAPLKGNEDGQYDIYVVNADGSNLTRLTENGGFSPSWSPDGQKIAFSRREGDEDHFTYYIYIMNPDGTNQTKFIEGLQPDWSPDGEKIAFSARFISRRIFVINTDGSNLKMLTSPSETTLPDGKIRMTKDESPKWSPDSEKIAFMSTRNENWDVYVMNADGSNQTRLTNHPDHDMYPAWSPP